jgi:hypothetical protein
MDCSFSIIVHVWSAGLIIVFAICGSFFVIVGIAIILVFFFAFSFRIATFYAHVSLRLLRQETIRIYDPFEGDRAVTHGV